MLDNATANPNLKDSEYTPEDEVFYDIPEKLNPF
jgi:hypothetical protein